MCRHTEGREICRHTAGREMCRHTEGREMCRHNAGSDMCRHTDGREICVAEGLSLLGSNSFACSCGRFEWLQCPCVRKQTIVRLLDPENEGAAIPQNVRKCLPIDTLSHPRELESSVTDQFFSYSCLPCNYGGQHKQEVFGSSILNYGCVIVLRHSVQITATTALHYKCRVISILLFTAML
jgi:hypothetical protein